MTLDQRLEALTQSLELMSHMQRDSEARHDAQIAAIDERLNQLSTIVRNISDVTTDFNKSIAMVTLDHAARLRRLEA